MPEVRAFKSYTSWWGNNSGGWVKSLRRRRPMGVRELQPAVGDFWGFFAKITQFRSV